MQTIGSQVKKIRREKGVSQEEMALAINMAQSVYSTREKSDTRKSFSAEEIKKIAKVLGVPVAVFYAEEESPLTLVSESMVAGYERKGIEISKGARQKRFAQAIDLFKKDKTYTEVSHLLHVDTDHLNGVRNGHKDVSIDMLAKSVKAAGVNANYVLAGIDPVLLNTKEESAEVPILKRRIEYLEARNRELERDKEMQQLLIDQLTSGKMKQTA